MFTGGQASGGAAIELPIAAELQPLTIKRTEWWRWLPFALSITLFVVIWQQFENPDAAVLERLSATPPAFWALFLLTWLSEPISQWIIYRRLWGIPGSGIAALVRKMVYNDMLLSYSGEAYFYAWARARTDMPPSPFGVVKDVAVTSALAGNLVTFLALPLALPALWSLGLSAYGGFALGSIVFMLLTSVAAVLFRRRVFALRARELWIVSGIHVLRVIVAAVLLALLWKSALPNVPLALWALLATLRLVVSRLPLIPNKDVILAGVTAFVVGQGSEVAILLAMCAALFMIANVIAAVLFAIGDLLGTRAS
jgi:hypothetical protein